MKKCLFVSIQLLLVLNSKIAYCKYVPEDFVHFYEYKKNEISVLLPDSNEIQVEAEINVNGVGKFLESEKVKSGLLESGVKSKYVELVYGSLIADSKQDIGIEKSFDYDARKLEVFVAARYLGGESKKNKYVKTVPDTSALILSNKLFSNIYDTNVAGNLNTQGVLGLGAGHMGFETSFGLNSASIADGDIVQRLNYGHDFVGKSVEVGYSAYGDADKNATSNFDKTTAKDVLSLSVFTNDNLLIKDEGDNRKLFFDMKAKGLILIKRDDKIIYSRSVSGGQNSVRYSRLPRGSYTVTVILRPEGYAEESYLQKINNVPSRTSAQGYDYSISVKNAENSDKFDVRNTSFADLAYAQAFLDNQLVLGTTLRTDTETTELGFGGVYNLEFLSLSGYLNQSDVSAFYNFGLNFMGLNVDYEMFDQKQLGEENRLIDALYRSNDYSQYNISYSFPIWGGNLSLFANRYKRHYDGMYSGSSDDLTLSLSFQKTIFRNISLSVGYNLSDSLEEGNSYKESVINTTVSIPLNQDDLKYTTGFEHSNLRDYRFSNTLSYRDDLFELDGIEVTGGSSLSQYVSANDSELSLSANFNSHSDKFVSNGYLNVSDKNNASGTLNAESTFIFTANDVYQTSESSDSYVVLDNQIKNENSKVNKQDVGLFHITENKGYERAYQLSGDKTFVGIRPYQSYKYQIDSDVSGFQTINKKNNNGQMFALPGNIRVVDNKIKKVISFMTYFEDFNNSPLNDVQCTGDGCVAVSKIGDGVYSISIAKDEAFKITSHKQICLMSENQLVGVKGSSQCFPQIEEDASGMQLVKSGLGDEKDTIYYLGVIGKDIPDEYRIHIANAGIKLIEKEFGDNVHLFANVGKKQESDNVSSSVLTSRDEILTKLNLYASYDDEQNQFTVIR